MKVFIKEAASWRKIYDPTAFGWGNGYVLIPEGHPLYGRDYESIDVEVHGGLTFSALVEESMLEDWGLEHEDVGKWIVGFDTGHYGDTIHTWPKERVLQEAVYLKQQLENYCPSVTIYI